MSIPRTAWLALCFVSLGRVSAGIVLPLLPTTPFLLLAAWAFANGSERLHRRLMEHPRLGPPILEWRRHGRVPRQAKVLATLLLATSIGASIALSLLPAVLSILLVAFAAVLLAWLWSRPGSPDRGPAQIGRSSSSPKARA